MHRFIPEAIKLLQKYKLLLKKQLSKEESDKILHKLQLHGTLAKDETSLYRLVGAVINHLATETAKHKRIRFSGKLQILKEMQQLLKLYRLEKNQLLHTPQVASRAIVEAIQLMVLPVEKQTVEIANKLKNNALKVAQYGASEQQQSFWCSLEKQVERNKEFFLPIIAYYQKCVAEQADSDNEEIGEEALDILI